MTIKNVHIVHAHPEPQSFITAMRDVAICYFKNTGANVTVSDLYEKEFNPVASASDFPSRKRDDYLVYSMEQRHSHSHQALAPDIAQELEKILEADLVVFTFPLFWFSTPAILKGWIDRVLLSGACYGGKRIYSNGGLTGRKALAIFGLGGRPHMFGPGSIHGELTTGMMQHFFQGTLGYVGFEVLEPFVAWHVPYIDNEARSQILADLSGQLSQLETRQTLKMPKIDNFGPTFEPLRAAR